MSLTNIFDGMKESLFMIDIETDGLEPTENSITSICITNFCTTGLYIDKIHLRIKDRYQSRIPNAKTVEWRWENNVTNFEASIPAFTAFEALQLISQFMQKYSQDKEPVLISNHAEFDVAFLKGYYAIECLPLPWKYYNIYDMGSMIKALGKDKREVKKEVLKSQDWNIILNEYFDNVDQPHNAFYDCMLQSGMLFMAFEEPEKQMFGTKSFLKSISKMHPETYMKYVTKEMMVEYT